MNKRTKIICTIGPSSWDPPVFKQLHKKGLTAARVNASFADEKEMRRVLKVIRDTSPTIAAILDLKGHKIRLNDIGQEPIEVKKGQDLILGTSKNTKSPRGIYVSYKGLAKDIKKGAKILIDDGKVQLRVTKVSGGDIHTKVLVSGLLKRMKTVSTPGTELKFPPLTAKDRRDVQSAVKLKYDYIAASFVRDVADVKAVRRYTKGLDTKILAKIEDKQGVANFKKILKEADGIMIARGDMGVELPLEKVPTLQREMIDAARSAAKPVVVATHMLESMVENPLPTRAETNDVAAAVFQGADCVMLSGETSTGKYPKDAVFVMSKILRSAEKDVESFETQGHSMVGSEFTDGIAAAVIEAVEESKVKKIIVLTATGTTARILAKYRMKQPLIAITQNAHTARHLAISYGVRAFVGKKFKGDRDDVINDAVAVAKKAGEVENNDVIIVVSGSSIAKGASDGGIMEIRKV